MQVFCKENREGQLVLGAFYELHIPLTEWELEIVAYQDNPAAPPIKSPRFDGIHTELLSEMKLSYDCPENPKHLTNFNEQNHYLDMQGNDRPLLPFVADANNCGIIITPEFKRLLGKTEFTGYQLHKVPVHSSHPVDFSKLDFYRLKFKNIFSVF